jgi:hypothetical protein
MTRTRPHIAIVAALAGASLASAAFAQEPAAKPEKAAGAPPAAAAPVPSPELDTLFKGYAGTWKCETTFPAGAMGPGSPEQKVSSSVKIQKDKELAGFWYRGEYQVKKTKTFPGLRAGFTLGYDPGSKAVLFMAADSMGGYVSASGSGATAEAATFTGDGMLMGQKMKMRESLVKKSDKEVEHKTEVDMGKGFQPFIVDVCKK